jgi:hypothetical protein
MEDLVTGSFCMSKSVGITGSEFSQSNVLTAGCELRRSTKRDSFSKLSNARKWVPPRHRPPRVDAFPQSVEKLWIKPVALS